MSDTNPTAIQIALKADAMRSDLVRGLVWFVNYAALDPTSVKSADLDLHGAAMLPEDVEKFAHRWMAFSRSVDINHDGVGRPVHVVESFFNSADVAAAAWPTNSHAVRMDVSSSKEALEGLRSGKLNSVSLDAYTFNKVVRLPVDTAKSIGLQTEGWTRPDALDGWVRELAMSGFEGVTSISQIAPNLFVAQRSAGMPVAVHIADGYLEANAAGGAWGHIGAVLAESPTLTSKALETGLYGVIDQPVDYTPWDQAAVIEALKERGIALDSMGADQFEAESDRLYASRDVTTQRGWLLHHTDKCVSRDGVLQCLARLHEVPTEFRAQAKAHLLGHLDAITLAHTEKSIIPVEVSYDDGSYLIGELPSATEIGR